MRKILFFDMTKKIKIKIANYKKKKKYLQLFVLRKKQQINVTRQKKRRNYLITQSIKTKQIKKINRRKFYFYRNHIFCLKIYLLSSI